MAFKTYLYGVWKKEIRALLQKRLSLKDKIRYHRLKADNLEQQKLPKVKKNLTKF